MSSRYAVYLAPPSSDALWRFGSSVLGYDAVTGQDCPKPTTIPIDDITWRELTEEPRRYGFHGTLKAPFYLAAGENEAAFLSAAEAFVAERAAFRVPRLQPAAIGRFIALTPASASPLLNELAAASVRWFEPFRAPLAAADRQRRLASPLTARQIEHVEQWGYPHVFDDFRFHMTLTGPLPAEAIEPVRSALAEHYGALEPGLMVDAITIFRQEHRAERFRVLARYPFGR